MKRLIWIALAALCIAAPALAQAADGYVTGNVNMRAGPDIGYPPVVTLPAGTPVAVQGCTQDWAWCDVIAYDNRGWVAGNFIQYDYDGQPVLLPTYAVRIRIPIVTFVISSYWGAHYRNRSFYRQRATWYRRPVPHRAPPPPLYKSPRPIHHVPARPAQRPRPMTNHAQPSRPSQYSEPARPSQHTQPSRPPQHSERAQPPPRAQPARPSQHTQQARPSRHAEPSHRNEHGKPASSSKDDDHGHH